MIARRTDPPFAGARRAILDAVVRRAARLGGTRERPLRDRLDDMGRALIAADLAAGADDFAALRNRLAELAAHAVDAIDAQDAAALVADRELPGVPDVGEDAAAIAAE